MAVTDRNLNVIGETKGQVSDAAAAKAKAAQRWTDAASRLVLLGMRNDLLLTDPSRLALMLNTFTSAAEDARPALKPSERYPALAFALDDALATTHVQTSCGPARSVSLLSGGFLSDESFRRRSEARCGNEMALPDV